MDPSEPARIQIKARNSAELAWILFHEGFRAGYEVPRPQPDMERYIRAMYELIVGEIREQNPNSVLSRNE
jgi:hypothetical protein